MGEQEQYSAEVQRLQQQHERVLVDMEKDLTQLRSEKESLQKGGSAKHAEVIALQQKQQAHDKDVRELRAANADLVHQNADLVEAQRKLRADYDRAIAQHDQEQEARLQLQEAVAQFQKKLSAAQTKINRLRAQIASMESSADESSSVATRPIIDAGEKRSPLAALQAATEEDEDEIDPDED